MQFIYYKTLAYTSVHAPVVFSLETGVLGDYNKYDFTKDWYLTTQIFMLDAFVSIINTIAPYVNVRICFHIEELIYNLRK